MLGPAAWAQDAGDKQDDGGASVSQAGVAASDDQIQTRSRKTDDGNTIVERQKVAPDGTILRLNPLYQPTPEGDYAIAWPSDRYAAEYGPRATYPLRSPGPETVEAGPATAERARRREFVALPERW